jgi:hypothetical protein
MMTVKHLMEYLSEFPEDMEVCKVHEYGDRVGHTCAIEPEMPQEGHVQYSDYTCTNVVVKPSEENLTDEDPEDDEDHSLDEDPTHLRKVLLI